MKYLTVKTLLTIAVMALSGSALATQVYLNQDGARAGSGTYYSFIYDGTDGDAASTATWDWTGGVLTQTGGFLRANQRIGSVPGLPASWLLTDLVTGLVIDTNIGTTTASTYECIEQPFGATTATSCYNTSVGFNAIIESSVAYNVGGNASCEDRTVGGDDVAGSAPTFPYRGLRSWNGTAPCGTTDGQNTGRGALDMVNIVQNSGGILVLGNANGPVGLPCYNPGAGDPGCLRAHWLVFSSTPGSLGIANAVPVPAAAWLFGSALGLLGWVRRRAMA